MSQTTLTSTSQSERILAELDPNQSIDDVADLHERFDNDGKVRHHLRSPGRSKGSKKIIDTELDAEVRAAYSNYQAPTLVVVEEKPEHKVIVWMKSQGKSNSEIFELLGGVIDHTTKDQQKKFADSGRYCITYIRQLVRQPWFLMRVARILEEQGKDALEGLFQSAALDSVETIIELRDTSKSDTVRANCSFHLLDRFIGKPISKVETKRTDKEPPVSPEVLRDEWDKLNKREAELKDRLLTTPTTPTTEQTQTP